MYVENKTASPPGEAARYVASHFGYVTTSTPFQKAT